MIRRENTDNLYSEQKKKVLLTLRHLLVENEYENKNIKTAVIFSVVDGSGTIVFSDGKELPLTTKECVFFDKGNGFCFRCDASAEIFVLQLNFSDFIDEQYVVFERQRIGAFFDGIVRSRRKIDGMHCNARRIQESLFWIENELENRDGGSEYVIKAYVALLLSFAMQYFHGEENGGAGKEDPHYKDIQKTILYINEHISEKISLDELAKIAMMGKTNYSVTFKKITGMTVWEYILNARVELASSYLMENGTEYNITELAFQCGFNNSAHFNKTFKKLKGKTPSDFKKDSDNPCF